MLKKILEIEVDKIKVQLIPNSDETKLSAISNLKELVIHLNRENIVDLLDALEICLKEME